MKNELGGKIMIELVALRPKSYSYLMDVIVVKRKPKEQKCVIKK